MIKNLEKDLRTYRKDTFITSFFATITILLIVLIICSVPTHAQDISGTNNKGDTYSYDNDSSNMTNLTDNYDIDPNLTNPQGLLNKADSNVKTLIPDRTNVDNAPDVYYLSSLDVTSSVDSWLSRSIPKTWTYNGSTYNLSDFNNFALLSSALNPAGGGFFELCLSNSDFGYYYTGRYLNQYDITSDGTCFMFIGNNSNNDLVIKSGTSTTYDYSSWNVSFNKTTNSLHNSYDMLVYSNCSVSGLSYALNEQGTGRVYSSADGMEYNYLNGQNGNGGTPEDIETSDNNLVLDNSDWIFSNKDYFAPYCTSAWYDKVVTNSVYPNGNITYTFIPNDYQIEHSSEFNLIFTFSWDYNVNYKNQQGGDSNKPFETTLLRQKNFVSNFQYYNNGTDLSYIEVPLSTFISNNNSMSWTFKEVMDKLYYNNYLFPDVLNITNKPYPDNKDFVDVYSYNQFRINATVFLDTVGGGNSSGNYTEFYNPMNREGGVSDDSGTINKNPYNNNSDLSTPGDAPGSAGNNTNNVNVSGSDVNINITNNNNNTNTVAGDSNTFKNVFESMIDGNKVTSEDLAESTGTNGFITFMNETISSIPAAFFTSLLTFFVTCLAILIIAFVLRMLLDIL